MHKDVLGCHGESTVQNDALSTKRSIALNLLLVAAVFVTLLGVARPRLHRRLVADTVTVQGRKERCSDRTYTHKNDPARNIRANHAAQPSRVPSVDLRELVSVVAAAEAFVLEAPGATPDTRRHPAAHDQCLATSPAGLDRSIEQRFLES